MRPAEHQFTELFQQLSNEAYVGTGDHNACGPIAVAIATGLPYLKVAAEFARQGRPFRGAAPAGCVDKVLGALGYDFEIVRTRAKTIRSFEDEFAYVAEPMLIYVRRGRRGHLAAFKDGQVHDYTRGSLRRIRTAGRVVKKA